MPKIPDLDAPIMPGETSAGIMIGSKIEGMLAQAGLPPSEVIYGFHKLQSAKVWSARGLVVQIGVYEGYRGLLGGKIGIGSTIAEVGDWCGCKVAEDVDDTLIATGRPGWSFETDEWGGDHTIGTNRNARVTAIFVFRP
jgi:hypothetical protein